MQFELRHAVFPILPLRPDDEQPPRAYCDPGEQGSAFFISRTGIFLTAKHAVGKWATDSYSVIAFHFGIMGRRFCRVTHLERHPVYDIALGIAEEPGPDGWPFPFTIGRSRLGLNTAVFTYGYANTKASPTRTLDEPVNLDDKLTIHVAPRKYRGHIIEHLPKAPLVSGPCYHVTCDPGGGISGGPLVRERTGRVHGVFSAGIPAHDVEDTASGFASDLAAILDDWPIPSLGGATITTYAATNPSLVSVR